MRKKSLIVALIVFVFDQLIKYIINSSFYYGKLVTIIPNFFYVTKVYNDGAAWSSFRGARFLLIAIAIIAFAFLLIYQKSFMKKRRNMIAFGLVYGGLFGNMLDRILYGHVIDFLKVNFGSYEFPIFNLADIAIVIGFIIILYAVFKGEDKNANRSIGK